MQDQPTACANPATQAPLALLMSLSLSGLLAAQAPATTDAPIPLEGAFRAPLHREDGAGIALWGSHDAYKVRVDADGATFTPALGMQRPHNLPVHWRTTALGGQPTGAATAVGHTDWRAELQHDGVVEAFDLRADGLEQTFVFAAQPQLPGGDDYRIEGVISSPLHAAARRPAHAPITFTDAAGDAVVRYGAAIAIDAHDRHLPLATSFDGERLSIHVPTDWLRQAAYPVVVDPLLSRVTVVAGSSGSVLTVQTAVDDDNDRMVVAYSRAISASDLDAFARRTSLNFGLTSLIYVENGTTSTKDVSVAWSDSDDQWLLAFGMQNANSSWVRIHLHPTASASTQGGSNLTVPQPGGYEYQRPVVSGHTTRPLGYVVFERDAGVGQPDTNSTEVYGARIDTSNAQIGVPVRISDVGTLDAQRPSICQRAVSNDLWFVAWQERNPQLPNDDWDIRVCRIDDQNNVEPPQSLPIDNSNGLHSFQPKVDSDTSDYGVAFLTRPVDNNPVTMVGTRLRLQRFYIPASGVPSSVSATDIEVAAEATARIELHDASRSFAMNEEAEDHGVVVWRRLGSWSNGVPTRLMAARFGYESNPLEVVELESSTSLVSPYGSVSATYDRNDDGFPLSYGGTGLSSNAVWGRRFDMPDAQSIAYGGSCAGTLVTSVRPWAGTQSYRFRLQASNPDAASWLWASLAPANLPLPGLTQCPVLLDPTAAPVIVDQDFSTNLGTAFFYFDLPAVAAGMDIYWQAMQLNLGNLFAMSNGLKTEIR
jgi:hypothetical protein